LDNANATSEFESQGKAIFVRWFTSLDVPHHFFSAYGHQKIDNSGSKMEEVVEDDRKQRSSGRLAHRQDYSEGLATNDDDEESESDEEPESNSISPTTYSEDDDIEMDDVHQTRPRRIPKSSLQGKSDVIDIDKLESRRSARSTKFTSSMAEPSNSIKEFFTQSSKSITKVSTTKSQRKNQEADIVDTDESEINEAKEPSKSQSRRKVVKAEKANTKNPISGGQKSPARRHVANRRVVHASDSSEDEDDSEEDDDQDEAPLRIHRILGSRTETLRAWREICRNMNSTEIHFGSRWYQPDNDENVNAKDGEIDNNEKQEPDAVLDHDKIKQLSDKKQKSFSGHDDDVFEERFLVKWWDLSYLHCSWEAQSDIVEQVESGKTALSTFFRKSINGVLYSADERCDGDYFDPAFVQIERILEIQFPDSLEKLKLTAEDEDNYDEASFRMIHDKNDPEFDAGTGRQFLVKWANLPYSDGTYEFERDLIMNEIEYKTHVKSFLIRSTKMSKTSAKLEMKRGEDEFKRLYKIFGENNKLGQREEAIEEYKLKLQERQFKNGGQLRDYQAEGVAWMISNYVNRRSSILCDEMGLGKVRRNYYLIVILVTPNFSHLFYRPCKLPLQLICS
jgi:Chromo (CHRromatin Organisation MOdifier) domain